MDMHVTMAETDPTHGTHGNKRAWLEYAVGYVSQYGLDTILESPGARGNFLQQMAEAGLGDYRDKPAMVQDTAIAVAIETALYFAA